MNNPIRVLLIDDHTLLRESLVRFLDGEPSLHIAAHCGSLAAARKSLAANPVDIVLLDYDLGDETGTSLLKHLRDIGSTARVLMLTAGMSPSATLSAFYDGVAGVVLKQTGTRQLVEAIESVARGQAWWGAETLRAAMAGTPDRPVADNTPELTSRQRLVLRGILDGLSNKEIASRLQVSETSIKASIQELFSKAGVRTRSQLVRVTLERFSATWLQD